jgi:hypothetical protein
VKQGKHRGVKPEKGENVALGCHFAIVQQEDVMLGFLSVSFALCMMILEELKTIWNQPQHAKACFCGTAVLVEEQQCIDNLFAFFHRIMVLVKNNITSVQTTKRCNTCHTTHARTKAQFGLASQPIANKDKEADRSR